MDLEKLKDTYSEQWDSNIKATHKEQKKNIATANK